MQFLKIGKTTTLKELTTYVGAANVENTLHLNGLDRTPNVGAQFSAHCKEAADLAMMPTNQTRADILNTLTTDSDVFEMAALQGTTSWKVFSSVNTFPSMLRIPDGVTLPNSTRVFGNGEVVKTQVYSMVMKSLKDAPHMIDPSLFNDYSSLKPINLLAVEGGTVENPMDWFPIPWGSVSLYSSLSGETIQFPVYPNSIRDGVKANYTTMPDLLYQYEPWMIYSSSGPRTNTYTFEFHRDMWTGDHRDGKANDLIRACMANCYPEYNGSAVNTSLVTLYIGGKAIITGVMTDVNVEWDGPLGLDGFYLNCALDITITEVSPQVLNYNTVRNKPLVG